MSRRELDGLRSGDVVVTEKMDGENTTMYRDGVHARSIDSRAHPSRTWVKRLQARIGPEIPDGWRVCGENLYAVHSIRYADLEDFFLVFGIWAGDRCLSWDETVEWTALLGLHTVPELYRGPLLATADLLNVFRQRVGPGEREGFVVRSAAGFARDEFATRVAKWVRPGHVRTESHWMHAAVEVNGLWAR